MNQYCTILGNHITQYDTINKGQLLPSDSGGAKHLSEQGHWGCVLNAGQGQKDIFSSCEGRPISAGANVHASQCLPTGTRTLCHIYVQAVKTIEREKATQNFDVKQICMFETCGRR